MDRYTMQRQTFRSIEDSLKLFFNIQLELTKSTEKGGKDYEMKLTASQLAFENVKTKFELAKEQGLIVIYMPE